MIRQTPVLSKIYLGLGSNIGQRRAFIWRAVAAVSMRLQAVEIRVSPLKESAPKGFDSPNTFVNALAEVTLCRSSQWTADDALALLDALQSIEKSISDVPHRHSDGSYRDREIDIDLIAVPGFSMEHPRLTLPHPRARERSFVMEPLKQLTGGDTIPE